MKKKIISSILAALLTIGVVPVGASAAWRQNSDNSWSWVENNRDSHYGWEQINGSWYYFRDTMQTGWLNIGYTYYLGTDGAMKTGWVSVDGAWYYLNNSGVLATDTVVDGYYVDSKGAMQPKENQKVLVDNKYVKITYLGVDKASSYSKKASLQVENKSNQDLIIQTDDVSVDGVMKYALFSPTVSVGKIATDGIEFSSSTISTNFDSIEGKFIILSKDFKRLKEEEFSIKF